MYPALNTQAIRLADQLATTRARIQSMDLMEEAGRQSAQRIFEYAVKTNTDRLVCICGSGNNGGDGFVIARYLIEMGLSVDVLTTGSKEKYSDDTATNYRRLLKLATTAETRLSIDAYRSQSLSNDEKGTTLIIDALLGTGLASDLRADMRSVVEDINSTGLPVIAIDIPTGINSSTGKVHGAAIKAVMTITMAAVKTGMLMGDGPSYCGEILVADIGIPANLVVEAGETAGMAWVPDDSDIKSVLPHRSVHDHKYSIGILGIIGGSVGLSGAPGMSALGAYRSGAGAVVCAVPASIQPVVAASTLETMTIALPENERGLAASGLTLARERLSKAKCLLVGPGLGRLDGTLSFVISFLEQWDGAAVIDADALYAISQVAPDFLKKSRGKWILTPHDGEFTRLGSLKDDRVETAREFATRFEVVLVLKGTPTLVASPDGKVFISTAGNKGFAKAGFGDVLAGMIGAFYSQGLTAQAAALCALHVGGRSAERYARNRSILSMMPTDLVNQVPVVLHDLEN